MRVEYAKYNRNRRPRFQIETVISFREGKRSVRKRALTAEAREHISDIAKWHSHLTDSIITETIRLPDILHADEESMVFEYVDGMSLDRLLFDCVLGGKKNDFFELLDGYWELLKTGFRTGNSFVSRTSGDEEKFEKRLFHDVDMEKIRSQPLFYDCAFLDAVFDNIIFLDSCYYLIDNEWVFESSIPVSFVMFRSLHGFHRAKHETFGLEGFVSFQELLDRYGIGADLVPVYTTMENNLQEYVIGPDREYQVKKDYVRATTTVADLEHRLHEQQAVIESLNVTEATRKQQIDSLAEKEFMLDTILHSRSWQLISRACGIIDGIAPAGSLRRRCLTIAGSGASRLHRTLNAATRRVLGLDIPVILVIDDRVPHYDHDAGSQTSFQYIRTFAEQGLEVWFMGDTFHRHEPYTTALEDLGVRVLAGPWFKQHWREWIIQNGWRIRYVYMNRPHTTVKYMDFLKQNTGAKLLYYGHDLHSLRFSRSHELNANPDSAMTAKHWEGIEKTIFNTVDAVYYPSPVEIEEVKRMSPSVRARVVPAYVYDEVEQADESGLDTRSGLLFVGGFRHAPNEDAVVWFVEQVLPLVEAEIPGISLSVVGGDLPERVAALASTQVELLGRVATTDLDRLYRERRIVVIPLRYGAGVKGKTVEAMAKGVPAVSTSSGIEGLAGVEEIMPPADDPQVFAARIVELYRNRDEWLITSTAAGKYVRKHFSRHNVINALSADIAWP